MKRILLSVLSIFALFFSVNSFAAGNLTVTTVALPAGNINQGSLSNIIYIAKLDVSVAPVSITDIIFNLTGTYSNTDLGNVSIYFNANAPVLSGASLGNNAVANFTAPHNFDIGVSYTVNAGSSVYVLITANINPSATDNHTVTINGATDPLSFTATTVPNVINNQTNAAGAQTIQASDITLTSIAVPAANINQGSNSNIIYIVKITAATESVSITDIIFNLTGTYSNTDLGNLSVYFNANAPVLSGASLGNNAVANFTAPHNFDIGVSYTVNAGSSVYVLITANINPSATDNHSVTINGATDPLSFTATTVPNVINNQTNAAGAQTIQASDITLTSIAVPAANINQGSNSNIIYIVKITAATEPVSITDIIFNLTGTYSNTDLGNVSIYFNANAPVLSGASLGNNAVANFTAPHNFDIGVSYTVNAGSSVYVLITANINPSATDNHTVTINGAADPLSFTATTVPNVINNQTNAAGAQTISAANITMSTVTLAPGDIVPGSINNIVYALKMDVGTQPSTITGLQVTIAGNYDHNDLGNIVVYANPAAPTIAGASLVNNAAANADGPHTFTIPAVYTFAAGSVTYILVAVNVNSGATINHTVAVNGATDPVIFTYTAVPNITNNQTNAAGAFNIANSTLPLVLTSFTAVKIPSKDEVQLQWVTAAENNTKDFQIQWSGDGLTYAAAGNMPAQGNSQVDNHYVFTHHTPAGGTNYYRLKMIDMDGKYSWSPVILVKLDLADLVIVPNPVTSNIKIVCRNNIPVKIISIYNSNGQLVWQSSSIPNTGVISIPFTSYPSGLYVAVLSTSNGIQKLSFIKADK